ncbi:hypothetical protein J6590_021358 [Homalodisca vitripennis]|nr:hypothetical protein J6590_021358 [Homalodisca vitripennis]
MADLQTAGSGLTFHWYYAVQIRPSFLRHPKFLNLYLRWTVRLRNRWRAAIARSEEFTLILAHLARAIEQHFSTATTRSQSVT